MGGNENTRTAAPKKSPRPSPGKNKGGARKYTEDVKCSVDCGPKNRPQSGELVPRGPARSSNFQKGGTGEKTVKSTSVSFLFHIYLS